MSDSIDAAVELPPGAAVVLDGAVFRVRTVDTSKEEDEFQLDVGGFQDIVKTRSEFRDMMSDADSVAIFKN